MSGAHVEFLNKDVALVAKNNGGVLVGRHDTTVLVVCSDRRELETNRPLILLCKECKSIDEAVTKQLYLVGKMCRKDPDSKYFAGAGYAKNMSNGDYKKHRKMDYLRWAEEIYETLSGPKESEDACDAPGVEE